MQLTNYYDGFFPDNSLFIHLFWQHDIISIVEDRSGMVALINENTRASFQIVELINMSSF